MSRWEFLRTNLCGLGSGLGRRASSFRLRRLFVVERASLARPTLSGWRHRDWATADKLFSIGRGTSTRRFCSQRPGGEPLWHVAGDLSIFVSALSPTKKCRNRRLPGITQGDDLSNAPIRLHPAHRAANRSVVPGSRLFSHVSAGLVLRRNSQGRKDTRQSGSPPGAGQSRVASTHHVIRGRGRGLAPINSKATLPPYRWPLL